MANKDINNIILNGARNNWKSYFNGTQAWSGVVHYNNQFVTPMYMDTANNQLFGQSVASGRVPQAIVSFATDTTSTIRPSVVEGYALGHNGTNYHVHSMSFNYFCSSVALNYDSSFTYIRNTNGLTFTLVNAAGQHIGSVWQNNTLIGTFLNTPSSLAWSFTLRWKLIGTSLSVSVDGGAYTTVSTTINTSTLTGRKTIIYDAPYASNDQGMQFETRVYELGITNYG